MLKKISLILYLVLFPAALALSLDPFIYTVEIKNFNDEIYIQSVSRYRLSSTDAEFALPENRHQEVMRRSAGDGKVIIEIRTGALRSAGERLDSPGAFLKDTRFLNLDSPEISGAAERLKKSKDPVRAVEDFVYAHIAEKTYGLPLLPARQVYRARRGDCTEHSVLSVALLRSLGVPARAIVGMYLADDFLGKKNVFVFHMWAEAYRDGGWRLVDATRPGGSRLNRYIALAEHSLKAETPLPYLRAISAIQDLSVEYLGK